MTLICTDLIWYEMRAGMVTTAMQSSQVQDGPSTVQVSTTLEQRGNQCRSGQRSESLESMAPSGCTCTLIYHLSSHIKLHKQRYFRHLLPFFRSQFSEVTPRRRSQTTDFIRTIAGFLTKNQKDMSKSWLLQCWSTSWCWRVPPTAARHSGTPQDPIQTHPESTDPPCWHGGGCVPKRTPPMEERRNPQWPVLLQRKGSENQVKLNFHESLRPVKNRECKFDHLWPSITIQNHPLPSSSRVYPFQTYQSQFSVWLCWESAKGWVKNFWKSYTGKVAPCMTSWSM